MGPVGSRLNVSWYDGRRAPQQVTECRRLRHLSGPRSLDPDLLRPGHGLRQGPVAPEPEQSRPHRLRDYVSSSFISAALDLYRTVSTVARFDQLVFVAHHVLPTRMFYVLVQLDPAGALQGQLPLVHVVLLSLIHARGELDS